MVAVRSAHINKAGEFDPEKWIASLGITSHQFATFRLTGRYAAPELAVLFGGLQCAGTAG